MADDAQHALAVALKQRAQSIAQRTGDDADAVEALERAVLVGDLARLTPIQRAAYYWRACKSLGLNPYTQPFRFLALKDRQTGQTRLILYVTRDATDQLRRMHGVSIDEVSIREDAGYIEATAHGHTPDGRQDTDIGTVLAPDKEWDRPNARMKAVTKAKRRLTLSIVGLGWATEDEAMDLPGAQPLPPPTAAELQAVEGLDSADADPVTGEMDTHG